MLFKRRTEASRWERFRVWLWPRVSWRRSWTYLFKRALRLSATPYAIAMGMAVGAFVSCTPFLGFHFVLTFALVWLLGGNLIAGVIGTAVGNPLTLPILLGASYEVGTLILPGEKSALPRDLGAYLMEKSFHQLWPIIKPMAVGSVPVGLVVGSVMYIVVYAAVAAAQAARQKQLQARQAGRS
jgi:uncharacterized protein